MSNELLNIKEVRRSLNEIISIYFTDEKQKGEMLELANQERPPVRGIFSELHANGVDVRKDHADAIKDIIYFYG